MKTLIFSDTHLTDEFDENKYHVLRRIIRRADRVIINGDFWKGTVVSFSAFSKSEWNKLFPLLLEKKTVYIYGNHDDSFIKNGSSMFAKEVCKKYVLKTKKYDYHITHGDIYTLPRSISRFFTLWQMSIDKVFRTHVVSEQRQFEKTKSDGYPNLKGNRYFNNKIRNEAKKLKRNKILVCGHSHVPTFELKNRYINEGFIDFGMAYYLEIDTQGNPKLHSQKIN